MQKYALDADPGGLEDWPFDNPASNYEILRGDPRASASGPVARAPSSAPSSVMNCRLSFVAAWC